MYMEVEGLRNFLVLKKEATLSEIAQALEEDPTYIESQLQMLSNMGWVEIHSESQQHSSCGGCCGKSHTLFTISEGSLFRWSE